MAEPMRIIVNGESVMCEHVAVTYEHIVAAAGKTGTPSVVYSSQRDGDAQRSGTMYPGCAPVRLTDVMIFTVAHTGNA